MDTTISDFDMAKIFVVDQTEGNTCRIIVTCGDQILLTSGMEHNMVTEDMAMVVSSAVMLCHQIRIQTCMLRQLLFLGRLNIYIDITTSNMRNRNLQDWLKI